MREIDAITRMQAIYAIFRKNGILHGAMPDLTEDFVRETTWVGSFRQIPNYIMTAELKRLWLFYEILALEN